MEYPLDYSDVLTVAIVAVITAFAVRRGVLHGSEKIKRTIDSALDGNIDIRSGLGAANPLGGLSDSLDTLLSRRASEIAESRGVMEEYERRTRELKRLINSGFNVVLSLRLDESVERFARALMQTTSASHAIVYLTARNGHNARSYLTDKQKGGVTKLNLFSIDQFFHGALSNSETIVCNNLNYDDRIDPELYKSVGFEIKNCIVSPVKLNGLVTGAVLLANSKEGFDTFDIEAVEFLGGFMGVAAENDADRPS